MKGEHTVTIVPHIMQQAQRVADPVACLFLGELVEFGDTRTIFNAPKNPITGEYVAGRFG
jgi:phosphate transport system ATP-binding protein